MATVQYNGFFEADYLALQGLGIDAINDYLAANFTQTDAGADIGVIYIFNGNVYDFLDLLEDEGVDADFTTFYYILSTQTFSGWS